MFGKRISAMAAHVPAARAVVGAIAVLGAGGAFTPAKAEFKVRSPIVDYRELEFEHNGDVTFDRPGSGLNNAQSFTHELEIGILPWWQPGIEAETETDPGSNQRYSATTFENLFQLTPQGKYWADLGFFAEFSHAAGRNEPDSFTFGPLIQKQMSDILGLDLGRDTLHTLNLLVGKEIGLHHSDATPLEIAWQSRLQLNQYFQPGVEYYGSITSIAGVSHDGATQHRLGPVLVGQYNMFQYGKIKYEVGYLFGLNQRTEQGAVRWRLEYEKPF
ncbi:MAG TPA: hypothetical protein VN728_00910 [Stellaceae bacterium]|nr:hypothetical protein [Stellaceae bacterium]